MNLSALKSLQSRVREATGPDRELDCLIACALLGGEPYCSPDIFIPGSVRRRRVGQAYFDVPDFTTYPEGLGACVALLHERFPGWRRDIFQMPDGKFQVDVWQVGSTGGRAVGSTIEEFHALETHALLLGIISATIAQLEATENADA